MKEFYAIFVLICIILISSVHFTSASAEILTLRIVHGAVTNFASVFGKTYPLQVDGNTYNIHYGFNLTYANATNVLLVPENNSMKINLKEVTTTDAMWIQFPQDLISADKNNFILYVNGEEKKYELATSGHFTIMGFMIPENTTLVEIHGTHVVPEFPMSATAALIISFTTILFFGAKIMRK